MTTAEQVLALTTHQLKIARTLVSEMRPPMGPPGRPRCAIFLTLIEQFEAMLLLAEAGLVTHGASHVRAMLESLLTLRLLGTQADHVEQMRFDQLRGEKNLLEGVLKYPELADTDRASIEATLARCLSEYKVLQDRNVRRAHIIDKFEPAGIPKLAAPYTLLCSFAHNDLAALALRHQGAEGMALRAGDTDDTRFMIVSLAHYVLVDAAAPIGGIAKFPDGAFEKHYHAMWETYEALMRLKK